MTQQTGVLLSQEAETPSLPISPYSISYVISSFLGLEFQPPKATGRSSLKEGKNKEEEKKAVNNPPKSVSTAPREQAAKDCVFGMRRLSG